MDSFYLGCTRVCSVTEGVKMDNVLKAIKGVIFFNSELIIRSLENRGFLTSEIENVRQQCKVLADNSIYPFRVENVSNYELFKQIHEFVEAGLKM